MGFIGVQITTLKLKQPNLGYINLGFFWSDEINLSCSVQWL